MPHEKHGDALPADAEGGLITRPRSPDMAAYWLAAVVDSADDAIVTKTLDGIITSWNCGAERVFGYTAAEVIGRPVTILIPSDHADEEPAILARIRAGERVEHYETVRLRKDGTLIDISLTVSPIRGADGRILGASKVARDISQRKRAEALVEGQRQVLELLVQGASLPEVLERVARTVEQQSNARGLVSILLLDDDGVHLRHGAAPSLPEAYNHRVDGANIGPVGGSCIAAAFRQELVISGDIATDLLWADYRDLALSHGLRACWAMPIPSSAGGVLGTFAVYYREPREPSQQDLQLVQFMIRTTMVAIERKRAEEAFARISEESSRLRRLYETALSNTPDLVYIFNPEGQFIYANEALLTMWGKSWAEAAGKNCHELGYEPWHAEMHEREIREVIATRRHIVGEVPFTGTQGRRIYEYIFVPVFGANGEVEAVAGTTRDVTERKQMEEERERLIKQLEWERSRLSYLFTRAPAFIATMRGPEHVFELANPAYLQLIGHRDIIGKSAREALPEIEGQGFFELLDRVFKTGEPFEGREMRLMVHRQPADVPEERFMDFVYQPIFEADGTISGIFAHGVDITEQVNARRQSEEANRLKDEFLATVSHELRTPLTAILGWAHMLRTGQFDGDLAANAFETIERNARAQAQLIDDLLDVSRAITGKLRIDVRPVEPSSFIEAAVEAVRPAAEAKGVRLQKVMDTGTISVSGDPVRLQQVIWNLLANAIKFTPRGGRVQVRLERVNSHVEIAVSDTGAGIAPDFLPHVFDRFRQADQKTTRRHGGLGLGLAIVRHLVELHGGTVRADSPGEGQGATFTVLLPVAPVNASEPPEGRVHPAARDTLPAFECPDRLDGLRVLVVDDEPDTREMLRAGLKQCGAQVTTAGSAAAALAEMLKSPPDILISDIGMPDEDGYSLIRKVRALPAEGGGRVPAIALTAYARVDDRMQALRAGYQMHVPKPVELAELAAVAASLVRRDG